MAQALNEAKQALADIGGGVISIGQNAARGVGDRVHAVVSSRWLQKLVIGTTLFAIAGVLLYIPAAVGYFFLYYKYLPRLETTVPVHLQYGVGPNPFGIASFRGIANRQAYDIEVSLTLPRSPTNLDRGNFMLALHLLSPSGTASDAIPITTPKTIPYLLPARPLSDSSAQEPPSSSSSSSSWHSLDALLQPTRLDLPSFLASHTIVHTTARPALIPYVDPLASLASRVLFLGYHLLAPRGAAAVRLTVPMAEGLAFAVPRRDAARVLPDSLLLEVQAGQAIQVYDARVTLVARLRGLQGFMYRWRVTAFVLFTAAFWMTEMVVMAVVLVVVGVKLGGRGEEGDGEEGKEGKDGGEDGNGASGDAGDAGDTGGYGDTDEYGDNGDQSGGSEDDEKGDLGTEVAKDRERRIKAEGSLSSAPETRTVKKEEEGARSMADVPSYPTGSSTEAGDEDEGKREEGPESKDTGTRSSSSQVTEGVARRRFLLSREDNSVSGD